MNNNYSFNNYISNYKFKELISDEELMKVTEVFANVQLRIPRRILENIRAYSKVLEIHKPGGLESHMILN